MYFDRLFYPNKLCIGKPSYVSEITRLLKRIGILICSGRLIWPSMATIIHSVFRDLIIYLRSRVQSFLC